MLANEVIRRPLTAVSCGGAIVVEADNAVTQVVIEEDD